MLLSQGKVPPRHRGQPWGHNWYLTHLAASVKATELQLRERTPHFYLPPLRSQPFLMELLPIPPTPSMPADLGSQPGSGERVPGGRELGSHWNAAHKLSQEQGHHRGVIFLASFAHVGISLVTKIRGRGSAPQGLGCKSAPPWLCTLPCLAHFSASKNHPKQTSGHAQEQGTPMYTSLPFPKLSQDYFQPRILLEPVRMNFF